MPAATTPYKLGSTATHWTVVAPDGRTVASFPRETPPRPDGDPVDLERYAVQTVRIFNEAAFGPYANTN